MALAGTGALRADAPRALPAGQLPADSRLQPLKDLDGYFPFMPPSSRDQWNSRREEVRRRILVSQGLWPMPGRSPLNPVIHGKIDQGDYTVENVYFESVPGFFVTGNLYRPKGKTGRLPGVLCPHGHWAKGRFFDSGEAGVKKEIAAGAEKFEEGGRSVLQARCVQLARMGCVVFHYDMVGYADSIQISEGLAHGFAKQRPEMNTVENWGLFSPQAEAHLQSVMGLQTWNSIRALDFLEALPDVDSHNLACTGASGGGTQTFILAALDSRLKTAFPAVMVGTAMQGGCTCENAPLLRIGTGNVEFAGIFAPKPLGMTCANDWTVEMSTKGFPELQQLYAMLGAPNNVMLKRGEQFGHNYNAVSRAAMYSWFDKHLELGLPEPVEEKDYHRLTTQQMSVWDTDHPRPPSGPDFERQLLHQLHEAAQEQLADIANDGAKFKQVFGGAMDVILGRNLAQAGEVEWNLVQKNDRGESLEMTGLLRNGTYREEVPVVFRYPKRDWNGQTVVWLTARGKAGLYDENGLLPDLKKLVEDGYTVCGVDLLYQGEFLAEGQSFTNNPTVKNPREAAAYTYCYNDAVFAKRVHDIISVVKFIKTNERPTRVLTLVGLDETGPLVAAAWAQCGPAVSRAIVNTGGFRFGKVLSLGDPNFLPGGAKYGDLPGMLALGTPGPLLVAGETPAGLNLVNSRYQAAKAADKLKVQPSGETLTVAKACDWLTGRTE